MSYWDTSYPPSLWAPVPPPPPTDPTGATPGTPGAFTPDGSATPATLVALQGLGSLGQTTKWAQGTYVALGDSSNAYWSGTAWVAGMAPADPPPEEPASIPDEEAPPA